MRHVTSNICHARSRMSLFTPTRFLPIRIVNSVRRASTSSALSQFATPRTYYHYFPQTLGENALPPQGPFKIDLVALRKEFFQLQAKSHPDLAPPGSKQEAENVSARINEAYRTLQDPLRRAQYILREKGIDVVDDEAARIEDQDLLMEVLEAREAIEEAEDEAHLEDLKTTNDQRIADSILNLETLFNKDDLTLAQSEAVKLRYWSNIKEAIDGWEKGKPVVLIH